MPEKVYNRIAGVFCMLWFITAAYAQYTVTGGAGTPLQAVDDTRNHIKVYMVYGMDNVEIRYSSSSDSHQWFRYKTSANNNSEPVECTQEGTTSFITGIEEGYGYYVKESENIGMNNFVWIIDYSKYAFDIQNLHVLESDNQCFEIALNGTVTMPELNYYSPGENNIKIDRELKLQYTTMVDRPDEQRFVLQDTVITITDNPFDRYYEPPLADTEFTITGDQFARHFNVEKSASTSLYQALAVKAVGDTTIIAADGNTPEGSNEEGLSAPVDIRFYAYGNTPTAERLEWMIYKKNNVTSDLDFIRRELDELTFSFTESGTYVAKLTAYGPSTSYQCVDSTYSFEIKIKESDLRIPNTFSPGTSPGINDEFKVTYKSLISFKCWIFNRWGTQLFYYTDPAKGWDGRRNGKLVPPGVYFYVIEARGSDGVKYNKKGHINILRSKDEQGETTE